MRVVPHPSRPSHLAFLSEPRASLEKLMSSGREAVRGTHFAKAPLHSRSRRKAAPRVIRPMRPFRLPLLLVLSGLAGCTTTPTPPTPAEPPPVVQPPAAPQPFFTQTGLASFYGHAHDGKITANGQNFDPGDFTAAHRTLAFGTRVRVTDLENGKTATVKITDRGPYVRGRIIDVSLAAARALGMQDKGVTRVRIEAFRADQPAG
jgi:rare lipoprotein A